MMLCNNLEEVRENIDRIDNELNDLETMQLVLSQINAPVFKHLGGVSEYNVNKRSK